MFVGWPLISRSRVQYPIRNPKWTSRDRRSINRQSAICTGVASIADHALDHRRQTSARPRPPARIAAGDPTSARSVRLKRHFDANSRGAAAPARRVLRRLAVDPRSSAESAASAASSAPRNAKRSPSPVIGSMKPAASPASSNPGTPQPLTSTASGPRQTGAATSRDAARNGPPAADRAGASRTAARPDRAARGGRPSRRRRWSGRPASARRRCSGPRRTCISPKRPRFRRTVRRR